MKLPVLNSAEEVEALVMDIGLLPLFACAIPGFSVEEATPKERWFVKDVEGPWEWREALAEKGVIAYGKVFAKKAGFIAPAYYPDLCNYRRGGMDFETLYEEGQVSRNEKRVMDWIAEHGPTLSGDLRAALGAKGLDTAVTSLQMRTFLTIQRLEYKRDAFGRPYGMGTSRFAASETVFGEDFVCSQFDDEPEASFKRLYGAVAKLCPDASEKQILAVLK